MSKYHNDFRIFQLIDRKSFDSLVEKHQMDKSVRSLKTWDLTEAMVNALALRLSSFREIEEALGIPRATFGDALSTRFPGFFQDLCDLVLTQIRGRTQDRRTRRAIREILAIDSTDCKVHGGLFSLPGWQTRRSEGGKAACKLHVVFNVEGQWIDDFKITGVRKHDSPVSLELRILPGKTYVFDRAYNDIDFWLKIIKSGSQFVTRLKECARIRNLLAEVLTKCGDKDGVLWDGFYVPSPLQFNLHTEKLEVIQIRHIIYRDPATKKIFHFVTSDKRASAQVIAKIYKRRWAVELLFRWLKSHLDIRYLAVKEANSVKIQLAIAVLLQLLLQLKKILTDYQGTLWDLLRSLRTAQTRQFLANQRFLLYESQNVAKRATKQFSIK
jgi:putative transposase